MQLEITWAFRMTRSLLVKYRCMMHDTDVLLHQVYPLPLFNTSSADQPASEHSGIQIFAEFKLEDIKGLALFYIFTPD